MDRTSCEIVVDSRERELPVALAAAGADYRVAALDVGDVEVWADGQRVLLLERKSLSDLAASVKDGRYAEQKARMLATTASGPTTVMYVVEVGSFATAFSFDSRMHDGLGGLPAATLQGCIVSMLLDARCVMTRDVSDTAAFVIRAAKRLSKRRCSGTVVSGSTYASVATAACVVAARKRDNLDPVTCFQHQLAQLPGVSVKLAGVLCAEFGSMSALYARLLPMAPNERVAAFTALPLIGAKKATQLAEFMFHSVSESG